MISTARMSPLCRLSVRIFHHEIEEEHCQNKQTDDQDDAWRASSRYCRLLALWPDRFEFGHTRDGSIPPSAGLSIGICGAARFRVPVPGLRTIAECDVARPPKL